MKTNLRTTLVIFFALPITLALPLAMSPPVIQAQSAPNQVHAHFELVQGLDVYGDSIENAVTDARLWMRTNLHNLPDDTGGPIAGAAPNFDPPGPMLSLDASPWPDHLNPRELLLEPDLNSWGFPQIEQFSGVGAEAMYEHQPFQPGFSAERTVDQDTLPPEGGTQILTIAVTPEEAVNQLVVDSWVQTAGFIHAVIVNIEENFPEGCEWQNHLEPEEGFHYEIFSPVPFETYELRVTIVVNPTDPPLPAEMAYRPFVHIATFSDTGNGQFFEVSGMSHENAIGRWTWEAAGVYNWNWGSNQIKEVNFSGYARCLFDTSAKRFHLSNNGLSLYDGKVVPEASDGIRGNLFTFTQFHVPREAQITSWSYQTEINPAGKGSISGTFILDVHMPYPYGEIHGTVEISFTAPLSVVQPPYGNREPSRYNFEGGFKIVGGTGFYEGIGGSGTIAGTFRDEPWDPEHPEYTEDALQKSFDFVLIGKAKFDKN